MCTINQFNECPLPLDFCLIVCHTKSMNDQPIISDDYLDWLFEQSLTEWEAEMNEEPPFELSTIA